MLDPRIYRAGLVAVALAVIVLAFSFENQPGAAHATLAPDAFNGGFAFSQMEHLAKAYPDRPPGSVNDNDLAAYVAKVLRKDGFDVSTDTFSGRTAGGTRTLLNVTATRAGLTNGSIVVVAPRDAFGSPAKAAMSGTATLLDLANVLSGETLQRTIVLASTSGSAGGAGAVELARHLPTPVDAVIVLGDMAGTRAREPVIVPWSNGVGLAPPELRNTVASALGGQTTVPAGGLSLLGQFAHLAAPMTISEQGAFAAGGDPAVLLSASGERGPAANEPVSEGQIDGFGRTVLQTISALDSGPQIPAPSAYMLFDGKVVPPWAIRLFVLVLILPVLATAIDGLARANRRGYPVARSTLSVLAAAVPFVLAGLAVFGARLTGLLPVAPPDPVGPGVVPMRGGDIALLAGLALLVIGAFLLGRWLSPRVVGSDPPARTPEDRRAGAAAVVPGLMCVVAIAIWIVNPLAAVLLVPALHLWIWIVDPDLRLHPAASLVLLLVGLAPLVVVAIYYATSLGFGPGSLLWAVVLMIAGGHIGVIAGLEWSLVLACTATVLLVGMRRARDKGPEATPVSLRGPITYAGPGSLGGTESALRARR